MNNNTQHLKSPKNQTKQKSRLGEASNEISAGLELVCDRSALALGSALVPQTLNCLAPNFQDNMKFLQIFTHCNQFYHSKKDLNLILHFMILILLVDCFISIICEHTQIHRNRNTEN